MPKKRFRRLTDRQIVCLLKYHRPVRLPDIKKLGIKLTYLDKGIDRLVYRMGKNLVIKIEDMGCSSFAQTPSEIEKFSRVHTENEFKALRKHIPKVLYSDIENGIIVVPYYPKRLREGYDEDNFKSLSEHIGKAFPDAESDLHEGNFMYAKDGTMVCVDLGYSRGANHD